VPPPGQSDGKLFGMLDPQRQDARDPANGATEASSPSSLREDALSVLRRLREAGHVAYFAGGCVRDLLLGLTPKDYDVATDAPPTRVRELFAKTQAVGAAFGVILVRYHRSLIEVATFRAEAGYQDGRHPTEVRFTTAEEDARRRDFTINGLFLDPLQDGPLESQVIDYVGGRADLAARVIRAIGEPDLRFAEDHLRLLRAIRFSSRLDFQIEPATADAIHRQGKHLARISPERIADELRRMLPIASGLRAWHDLRVQFPDLSDVIFRFACDGPDAETRRRSPALFRGAISPPPAPWPFGLCLAYVALDWQLSRSEPHDPAALVGALARPAVQQMARALRQSLRISNEELDEMTGTLEGVGLLLRSDHPLAIALVKRFLARPTAVLSRRLLSDLHGYVDPARLRELLDIVEALAQQDYAPQPLITGDDLTTAGLMPSPLFKRILDSVYDAQLETRITTREQGLALALQLAATS
jgi:poly(A) polymerase